MAFSDVDMKILWSRAAGLCAFPDCRELLVRFSTAGNGVYQIGEMSHLVARSLKGPRGEGALAPDARDSYDNHILLCPTCHAEIDKNPRDYPVEKLQRFKALHENWVAATLLANIGSKPTFLAFYGKLLSRIEHLLHLGQWNRLIDHLWRDLAPSAPFEMIDSVRAILLNTLWPGHKPRLEEAFKAVLRAWSDYCANFSIDAQYHSTIPGFLV